MSEGAVEMLVRVNYNGYSPYASEDGTTQETIRAVLYPEAEDLRKVWGLRWKESSASVVRKAESFVLDECSPGKKNGKAVYLIPFHDADGFCGPGNRHYQINGTIPIPLPEYLLNRPDGEMPYVEKEAFDAWIRYQSGGEPKQESPVGADGTSLRLTFPYPILTPSEREQAEEGFVV